MDIKEVIVNWINISIRFYDWMDCGLEVKYNR